MIIDRDRLAAALPSYEVKGELGSGGFGLVVAAQHRQLGRDVAIKILAVSNEVAHDRFVAEARLLARMDHRHIVRVHDYVEYEGLCLIIMELLAGGSLTRHLPRIPAKQACAVGVAVAEALSYAHAQGVLHRDVKPDNVLFDAAGLLKVTDFGIAKIFDGSRVSASMVAGTPAYMAPEQIKGDQLGPATDIYALGVVLYQMLAGMLPFDPALPLFKRYEQQLTTMPPPPAGVPRVVANAVMHALASDMQARPRSAKDFALELAAAADRGYGPSSISGSRIPLGAARHARVTTVSSALGEVPEALATSRSIAGRQPTADQRGRQPVGPGRSASSRGKRRIRWAWVAVAAVVAAAGVFLAVRLPSAIASHSGGRASAAFSWAQANPAMSPSGRQYAAMAYDPATRQMVLFSGGIGSGGPQSPDTWIWNGINWSQATPRTSPPAREGAVLAYDGATRQLVLFGGETGTNSGLLSDTWTWDGANWIQLDPATSPSARYAASMTYDPATRELVLFGGFGAADNSDNLNDTWTWNGTDWIQEHPVTSPAARVNAGLAYNPHDAGIVLFGGTGPSPFGQAAPASAFFSDTWLWNGTDWIQENPVTSPPARTNVSLVYDQAAGQDILFGGIGSDGSSLGDTWAWDGSTWNQVTTSTSPSARSVGAMAYDGATRQVVLFSGWNGSAPDDTWNLGA